MIFGLGPEAAAWCLAAGLLAGFVRGYSGFGFAALVITGGGLVADPRLFVPVVILSDLVLTGWQARQIRGAVDWGRVGWLLAGGIVAVPAGVAGVAALGPDGARIVISALILAVCAVLWTGWRFRARAPGLVHGLAGIGAGLANGAAVGGLVVAAFLAAQPVEPARFRATMVATFAGLSLWTLPVLAWGGLIERATLVATATLLPAMALGVWLGTRHFLAASPEAFRQFAIALLAGLALIGLGRSLI